MSCNHNLQDKLTQAIAAYNTTVKQFEQVRESLLQQQGSIQMLEELINSETPEEDKNDV